MAGTGAPSSTGYIGVVLKPNEDKYRIIVKGKYIGRHPDIIEAARRYNEYALRKHKDLIDSGKMKLNEIPE